MGDFVHVRKRGPSSSSATPSFKSIIQNVSDSDDDTKKSTSGSTTTASNRSSSSSSKKVPLYAISKEALDPITAAAQNKFLEQFKVCECKKDSAHDKKICMFYHSKADRRRNPYEFLYSCVDCATFVKVCESGDKCNKAHGSLEKMFHPDLYKKTMCSDKATCRRGKFCAFAHNETDHRINAPAHYGHKPSRDHSNHHSNNNHSSIVSSNKDTNSSSSSSAVAATSGAGALEYNKVTNETRVQMKDKLVRLIRSQGSEGIISSEVPKRYNETYAERLDMEDSSTGQKFRIKDLLLEHPNIEVLMHKGVQPKYVYVEENNSNNISNNTAVNAVNASNIIHNNNNNASNAGGASSMVGFTKLSSKNVLIGEHNGSSSSNSNSNSSGSSISESDLLSSLGDIRPRRRGPSTIVDNAVDSMELKPSYFHDNSNSTVGSNGNDNILFDTSPFQPFGSLNSSASTFISDYSSTSLNDPISSSSSSNGNGINGNNGNNNLISSTFFGDAPMHLGLSNPFGGGTYSLSGGAANNAYLNSNYLSNVNGDVIRTSNTSNSSDTSSLLMPNSMTSPSVASTINAELSGKYTAAKAQVLSLQGQILTLREIVDKNQSEMQAYAAKLHETLQKLSDSEEELDNSLQTNEKYINELSKVTQEVAAHKVLLKQKEVELHTARENLKHSENNMTKLEATNKSLVPEIKQLRSKLSSYEGTIEAINIKNKALEKSKNELSLQVDMLKKELDCKQELAASGEGLEKEVVELKAAVEKCKVENDALKAYVQHLKKDSTTASNATSSHTATALCHLPNCSLTAHFKCAGSCVARYCGQIHQKEHWKVHKKYCTNK